MSPGSDGYWAHIVRWWALTEDVSYNTRCQKLESETISPFELTAIFKYWCSHQRYRKRWAGSRSDVYRLECGVRPGSWVRRGSSICTLSGWWVSSAAPILVAILRGFASITYVTLTTWCFCAHQCARLWVLCSALLTISLIKIKLRLHVALCQYCPLNSLMDVIE